MQLQLAYWRVPGTFKLDGRPAVGRAARADIYGEWADAGATMSYEVMSFRTGKIHDSTRENTVVHFGNLPRSTCRKTRSIAAFIGRLRRSPRIPLLRVPPACYEHSDGQRQFEKRLDERANHFPRLMVDSALKGAAARTFVTCLLIVSLSSADQSLRHSPIRCQRWRCCALSDSPPGAACTL
jgi:hypothetical protein